MDQVNNGAQLLPMSLVGISWHAAGSNACCSKQPGLSPAVVTMQIPGNTPNLLNLNVYGQSLKICIVMSFSS